MKEVVLSNGKKVIVKKGKAKDYIQARKIATSSNTDVFLVLLHLLVETPEGKKLTLEELEELPLGDYMALENALFEVNPLPEDLKKQFSPSSDKVSDTLN